MIKINLICDIFGASGFSVHGRNLANALHQEGAIVRVECQKPQGFEMQINDAELLMLTREFDREMISILVGQPQWLPLIYSERPKKTFLYLIFEGGNVPKYWKEFINDPKLSGILVPSKHVELAVRNTFECNTPISVAPHGVDLSLFKKREKQNKEVFSFVGSKGWAQGAVDRGGVQYLLRAYCEEFSPTEKVELKLKINPSYTAPGWNLNNEIGKLNLNPNHAPLQISCDLVPYQLMPLFYDGDVFVSPTMSEAFNLPLLEANACGLPCITTGFPGQDVVTEERGWLIDCVPFEVKHDLQYEGISWFEPSIPHLRQLMRRAFNDRKEVQEKAEKAYEFAQGMSWRDTARKVLEVLK